MSHKIQKSKIREAGKYEYRGTYIQKSFVGSGWYVRAVESTIKDFPKGLEARTLGLLQVLINNALDK